MSNQRARLKGPSTSVASSLNENDKYPGNSVEYFTNRLALIVKKVILLNSPSESINNKMRPHSNEVKNQAIFQNNVISIDNYHQKTDQIKNQNENQIIKYISEKLNMLLSPGINNLKNNKSLEEVQRYCASQILLSIILLSERTFFTQGTLKKINQQLSTEILPYFCIINNTKMEQNLWENRNWQGQSLIKMGRQQQKQLDWKRWNRKMMELLNQIYKKQLSEQSLSLRQNFISDLKEKLKNLSIQVRDHEQKNDNDNYKGKFQIKKKVTQNWKVYSNYDIQSGCMSLNLQQLRFFQHWYKQLKGRLQGKFIQQYSLDDFQTKVLIQMLEQENVNFSSPQGQFYKIRQNIIKSQSQFIKQGLNSCFQKYSDRQSKVGQFSSVMCAIYNSYLVKCLYLLTKALGRVEEQFSQFRGAYNQNRQNFYEITRQNYLNLKKIQEKMKEYSDISKQAPSWIGLIDLSSLDIIQFTFYQSQSQIQLILNKLQTRQIYDISKGFSAQTRQIQKISDYEHILRLQDKNKLKIKLFLKKLTGQKQYSQMVNGFVKKLINSQNLFGPVLELCNIWMHLDNRSSLYLEKIQNLSNIDYFKSSKQLSITPSYIYYNYPFKCSNCQSYNTNFCQNQHLYNPQTNKYICYPCQFYLGRWSQKIKMIPQLEGKEILGQIPLEGGSLINLSCPQKSTQFITVLYNKMYYLLDKRSSEILFGFKDRKLPVQFVRQNVMIKSQRIKQNIRTLKEIDRDHQIIVQNNFLQPEMDTNLENLPALNSATITNHILSINIYNGQLNSPELSALRLEDFLKKEERKQIQRLNIQECNGDILKWMQKFEGVEELEIEDNNLQQIIDQFFWNNKHLGVLRIKNNIRLKNIYFSSNNLSHLKILEIKFNYNLSKLPPKLCCLPSLIELHIQGTNIQQLYIQKGQSNLQVLFIVANRNIRKFSQNFGELRSLKLLAIFDNKMLQSLPVSIGKLSKLQRLIIKRNSMLKNLPESIWELKSINNIILEQNLNLSQMCAQKIDEIYPLKGIKIENNIQLYYLPENLGKLINLQEIIIEGNNLVKVPKSIGNLRNLKNLSISKTFITKLPEQFGNLKSLTHLTITHNYNLQKLCQSFGNLTLLSTLVAKNNHQLSKLPFSFGMLTNLETLNLKNNNLLEFPESFGKLKSLTFLKIDLNINLRKLPKSFCDLERLNTFSFIGTNNLLDIPSEHLKKLSGLKFVFTDMFKYQMHRQMILSLSNLRLLKIYYDQNSSYSLLEDIREECIKNKVRFQCEIIGHK